MIFTGSCFLMAYRTGKYPRGKRYGILFIILGIFVTLLGVVSKKS